MSTPDCIHHRRVRQCVRRRARRRSAARLPRYCDAMCDSARGAVLGARPRSPPGPCLRRMPRPPRFDADRDGARFTRASGDPVARRSTRGALRVARRSPALTLYFHGHYYVVPVRLRASSSRVWRGTRCWPRQLGHEERPGGDAVRRQGAAPAAAWRCGDASGWCSVPDEETGGAGGLADRAVAGGLLAARRGRHAAAGADERRRLEREPRRAVQL